MSKIRWFGKEDLLGLYPEDTKGKVESLKKQAERWEEEIEKLMARGDESAATCDTYNHERVRSRRSRVSTSEWRHQRKEGD